MKRLLEIARRVVVGVALGAPLALGSTLAPAPAVAEDQIELTEPLVVGLIASYPAVKDVAQSFEGIDAGDGDDPVAALGALATYQNAMGQLDAAVTPHGFTGYMHWLQTLSAVGTTYIFTKNGGVDAQMAEAMEAIRSNSALSDAQKEAMLAQMQAAAQSMAAARPSEANIAVVNDHIDELEALFETD